MNQKNSSHYSPGVEPLLMQHGVDLALWGHVHAYERLWPVYGDLVFNGTAEEPYTNPGAPVHLTSGSVVRMTVPRCSFPALLSKLTTY